MQRGEQSGQSAGPVFADDAGVRVRMSRRLIIGVVLMLAGGVAVVALSVLGGVSLPGIAPATSDRTSVPANGHGARATLAGGPETQAPSNGEQGPGAGPIMTGPAVTCGSAAGTVTVACVGETRAPIASATPLARSTASQAGTSTSSKAASRNTTPAAAASKTHPVPGSQSSHAAAHPSPHRTR